MSVATNKPCRKCGSRDILPFLGTNGASFLKCQTCGHKRRHGMDAEQIRTLLGVKGPVATPVAVPALDPAAVNKLVGEALTTQMAELRQLVITASKPQIIEVKQDKGASVQIEGGHYMLGRLIKLVRAGFHVFLWGDAGTGKTTAAIMAAEALKRECEVDTFDPTTFRSNVQGFMTPVGKPVHTTFTRCWTEGKIYIGDEIDNSPGYIQTLFNSALANGMAPLAWGNVAKHEKNASIFTGNTPGRPTRAFPDRKPMSAAFADRLYFVHWPLDPAIEMRSADLPYTAPVAPKATPVTTQQWVKFVIGLRQWAKVQCPTLMITPRASLLGIQALKAGERWEDVADALIFRGADEDIRSKALNAVRLA